MADLFTLPFIPALTTGGVLASGAKLYFFETGTTTPAPVYTSSALSTPHAHPVVADSAGRFAAIYLDPDLTYRVRLTTSAGVTIGDFDPVNTGDLRGDLQDDDGSSLITFLQAGANSQARTVQDKLRDTISLLDKYDGEADHTLAFSRMITDLNAGGFKQGIIPAGEYNIASATWASLAPQITRDGITIKGDKGAKITLTGSTVCNAIFHFVNVAGRVEGINFYGNAQGSGYTNGCAIRFEVNTSATASITHAEVVDCTFDNFKSPYWIYGYVTHATYGISSANVSGNHFTSRAGSTMLASDIGQRTAFICFQSKTAALAAGGGVSNITIRDNKGDCSYVKSMLILSDFCRYGIVDGNIAINAGLNGATDDAGGSAFQLYDSDSTGASDIIFTNNQVLGVRSCGLYVAGLFPGLVVDGLEIRDQTDTVVATLPKGGVVINGCRDFQVSNIVVRNIAAYGVYFIPSATAFDGGVIDGIKGFNCLLAGLAIVSANITFSGLRVSDVVFKECTVGVSINLVNSGTMDAFSLSGFTIVSSVASSYGVRMFTSGAGQQTNTSFTDGTVQTVARGIDVSGMTYGWITINNIRFNGSFTTAALHADTATKLDVDNLTFSGLTAGYCLRLASAQGALGLNLRFLGCDNTKLINISGTDLGRSAPTWTMNQGTVIRRVDSAASGYIGWVNTDGGTTWKTFGAIAA